MACLHERPFSYRKKGIEKHFFVCRINSICTYLPFDFNTQRDLFLTFLICRAHKVVSNTVGTRNPFYMSLFLFIIFYHNCYSCCLVKVGATLFYINLVPSREETSFLTTFYGLYFSHHYTHITHYKSCRNVCAGSFSSTALWTLLLLRYGYSS